MSEFAPTAAEVFAVRIGAVLAWWWLGLAICSLARLVTGFRSLRLSAPFALIMVAVLHSDAGTALDGLTAPLGGIIIEPWFYGPALVQSVLGLATALFVRAVVVKRSIQMTAVAALTFLWIPVLNLSHALFIHEILVSWVLVLMIPSLLGLATFDIWMSFKKKDPNRVPVTD